MMHMSATVCMTMRAPGAGRQLLLSVERPLKYRYPGTGAFVLGGTEPKLPARYLVGPDIVEQPPRKEPGVQYARLPVRHSDLTPTRTARKQPSSREHKYVGVRTQLFSTALEASGGSTSHVPFFRHAVSTALFCVKAVWL